MTMIDKKVMRSVISHIKLDSQREFNFQHIIYSLFSSFAPPNSSASQTLIPIPCRERNDITRINHHQ